MNEPANFCHGVCFERQRPTDPIKHRMRWIPGNREPETKNPSLDIVHKNDRLEFETHSDYPMKENRATYQYLTEKLQKRAAIISRSNVAGQHKFGSLWLGDNFATMDYLKYSISGILSYNIFGFTVIGADICGFIGDTSAELCTRWTNVGVFYPFARNHNNIREISQEPYEFMKPEYRYTEGGLTTTHGELQKTFIQRRYNLINYFYTEVMKVSEAF